MLTILVILLPLLYQIASPIKVVSLGELLLIPVMTLHFINIIRKKKIRVDTSLLIFYGVPILTTLVFSQFSPFFKVGDAATVVARILFYTVLIICSEKYFDINKGFKAYYFIGNVLAVYLFTQVLFHYVVHTELPIPANYPNILFSDTTYFSSVGYYRMYGFRPASLFLEPSYYADYLAPLVALLLFSNESLGTLSKSRRIVSAFILTASILLSTSSLGVLYCAVIWIYFIFSKDSGIKIKTAYKLFVTIIIVVGVVFVLRSTLFERTVSRVLSGSSINARFVRGIIIFSKENLYQKIFGVGLNNIENFVKYQNIITSFDESNLNYTVTFTNRLIATGFVGTAALLYFWVDQIRRKQGGTAKVLLFIMLVSFIFANGEYTYAFPFLFILVNSLRTSKKGKHTVLKI